MVGRGRGPSLDVVLTLRRLADPLWLFRHLRRWSANGAVPDGGRLAALAVLLMLRANPALRRGPFLTQGSSGKPPRTT